MILMVSITMLSGPQQSNICTIIYSVLDSVVQGP